jgi:hypothetical protein
VSARLIDRCGLCGSSDLKLVLSLGSSPPTCAMAPVGSRAATERYHPLELLRCRDCTLVQLSVVVDPEVVFSPGYPYSSGNSRALHDNFAELAHQVSAYYLDPPTDLVVDVGANDGTLLSKFERCRTVGVEPTGQAERIAGPAYREFFTQQLAQRIVEEHGQAKVVTACNVLAHVEDIGDVMRGIDTLLADDGVLVAENHDLASVVDGQWDTVYHEHLRFYDRHSFHRLLATYGFGARAWQQISTHGGSFRVLAERSLDSEPPPRPDYDFAGLAGDMARARENIRRATAAGRRFGIGATARATTIINYCGLDVDDIECVCEVAGSDKIGHYIPGTRIPVVDEAALFEQQPPGAVLFSWHLADGIVPKLRERGYEGVVVVPLPTLHCLYKMRPLDGPRWNAVPSRLHPLSLRGGADG